MLTPPSKSCCNAAMAPVYERLYHAEKEKRKAKARKTASEHVYHRLSREYNRALQRIDKAKKVHDRCERKRRE